MRGAFVGRSRELTVARGLVTCAARGDGSVLAISGEPGIGKSRLAREVASLARADGAEVVWAAGWPEGGAPTYWPWPEILASDAPGDAGPELLTAPPDAERFDRFRAVGHALQQRATRRPLVVVLDDAHTIDADGLLLTRFVSRSIVGHPVLLVLTYRSTPDVAPPTAAVLDDIGREGTVLRLQGLERRDVQELVATIGTAPEAQVVQRVHELTGGNPFLVEHVLDAGLHMGDRLIPDAALRLVDAQLDPLDDTTRGVLEAAAVLGPAATLHELAIVAAVDDAAVEPSRARAARAGLVVPEPSGPVEFTHDLAREAVLARLATQRLADLHRASLLALDANTGPERAVRRAHHALALARCWPPETESAVAVARSSARILLSHGAPEAAVELLSAALAADEAAGVVPSAELVTELGTALLTTGRLDDSRRQFRRAVAAADQQGDPLTFASAALGLGGVWVQEHRSPAQGSSYLDLVERAIEGIAAETSSPARGLAASLRLRRATELASIGELPLDDVRAALDTVRASGDRHALAAGLSLVHHILLGPMHARERAAVAAELLATARGCGDEFLILMGLVWTTVDALLDGRPVDRELADLRERADALGMQAILFVIDAIDVMRLLRAGELDSAAEAADLCLRRGIEVGDADATTYYGAHLLTLRWYQDEAVELLPFVEEIAASTAIPVANPVFTACVAALAARAGDVDRAERALKLIGRGQLRDLRHNSNWLLLMASLVEAAVLLDDVELAEEVGALLAPYASLPVVASVGVCCLGSAERSLGLAARVAGRLPEAIAHLERAVSDNQRLGNRPMTAVARGELAMMLLDRGQDGDLSSAEALLVDAIEAGFEMNLETRVTSWTRALEEARAAAPHPIDAQCERDGEVWVLTTSDEVARVRHTVGMSYLATLLGLPGVDVSVGSLAGVEIVSPTHDVLDQQAIDALRDRVRDLQVRIDSATLGGQVNEASALQDELEGVVSHASAAMGQHGRSRRFDDPTERARTAVQKAVRRAIANVGRDAPDLAQALQTSVQTGYQCRYEPSDDAPKRWSVRTE